MLSRRRPRSLRIRALAACVSGRDRRRQPRRHRARCYPTSRLQGCGAAASTASARSSRRLGIDAGHVIFGHTHRTGPLPEDDASEWGPFVNAGSWVRQPHFTNGDASPRSSPYRAGGAVMVDDAGPPQVRMLLDDQPSNAVTAQAPA